MKLEGVVVGTWYWYTEDNYKAIKGRCMSVDQDTDTIVLFNPESAAYPYIHRPHKALLGVVEPGVEPEVEPVKTAGVFSRAWKRLFGCEA